ncbi:MAG: TIGR02391 family protein [Acidimicrobiales bacterium]
MAANEPDYERIKEELRSFIIATRYIASREVAGGSHIACGRDAAVGLVEKVSPILETLYPDWRESAGGGARFAERERFAAQQLLARLEVGDEIEALLGDRSAGPRLAASSLHPLVWDAANPYWRTLDYHGAVDAAAKIVNSRLQQLIGRRDLFEKKLVEQAFSSSDPGPDSPRLRFAASTDATERARLDGARSFGIGLFEGVRNPLSHLPAAEIKLSEQLALEQLAAWSLFARWIEEATLTRASAD